MLHPKNVMVTTHALDQWRLRAAEYATAQASEVIKAVKESRQIKTDEHLPFRREAGIHYYYHPATKCYFVVEPLDRETCRVITVILPGFPMNPLNPKTKRQRLERLAAAMKEVPQPPRRKEEEVEVEKSAPAFANIDEEYNWHRIEYGRVCELLSTHKKTSRYYTPLSNRVRQLSDRLKALKPAYLEYRKRVDAEHDKEVFRLDGSINFQAAARMLIERVDQQDKEIAALKSQLHERWTIPLWDRTLMLLFLLVLAGAMIWAMCNMKITFP